jgi:hypothetical protein
VRLMSLKEPQWQGWSCPVRDGGMNLRHPDRDLFANIAMVNNVYLVRFSSATPMKAVFSCMDDARQRCRIIQGSDVGRCKVAMQDQLIS